MPEENKYHIRKEDFAVLASLVEREVQKFSEKAERLGLHVAYDGKGRSWSEGPGREDIEKAGRWASLRMQLETLGGFEYIDSTPTHNAFKENKTRLAEWLKNQPDAPPKTKYDIEWDEGIKSGRISSIVGTRS